MMRIALPVRADVSAWLAAPARGDDLRREAVAAQVAQAFEVRTTVPACWAVVGVEPATGRLLASKRTYAIVAVGPVPVAFV